MLLTRIDYIHLWHFDSAGYILRRLHLEIRQFSTMIMRDGQTVTLPLAHSNGAWPLVLLAAFWVNMCFNHVFPYP